MTDRKLTAAQRKARREELQYGPGGMHGPYATRMREQPCCTCGRTGGSECSHVRTKGAGGRWWDMVPQCHECHRTVVHQKGWGECKDLALKLAHHFAWLESLISLDNPVPSCNFPMDRWRHPLTGAILPRPITLSGSVSCIMKELRTAWSAHTRKEEVA